MWKGVCFEGGGDDHDGFSGGEEGCFAGAKGDGVEREVVVDWRNWKRRSIRALSRAFTGEIHDIERAMGIAFTLDFTARLRCTYTQMQH